MDYAGLRARVVGALDERRRNSDDPVVRKGLHRVMSMAVWVLDQNRYKPEMELRTVRALIMDEIDIYLKKMFVDGFGDEGLRRAVEEGRDLVATVLDELIAASSQTADAGAAPKA
ncbi:MAG: hypothetical protein H0Z37_00305 [Firmicutes bacterium]|nr:hypothetical protein [Bacillota bacterium]